MKTYKYTDGRDFRLSGTEIRHDVQFTTIFWLEAKTYEEFVHSHIDPILSYIEPVVEVAPEVVVEIVEVKKPRPKKKKTEKSGLELF